MTNRPEFWPTTSNNEFRRWDLPAQGWSHAEHGEDSIKVIQHADEWSATTEFDQCTHRDLNAVEILSVRAEFYLAGEA